MPIQSAGKRKIKDKTTETVFIVQDRKAKLKEVTTGASSDTDTEIISGIEEGDTVIVGPYKVLSKLEDGQQVDFEIAEDDTSSSLSLRPRRLLRSLRKRT